MIGRPLSGRALSGRPLGGDGLGSRRHAGGGVRFSPHAAAFFARLATQPTSLRKRQYNTLITSLVGAGIWDKLDALLVLAAADSATALTNLKSSSFAPSAVNSPTFTTDRGFASNASTSYLNANYTPSTAGGVYVQNSAHISLWNRTESDGPLDIGVQDGTTDTSIYPLNTGATYGRINDPTSGRSNGLANSSAVGHMIANRSGASAQQIYYNGTSLGAVTAVTSSAIPTKSMFVCGYNDNGTPFLPGSHQIAAYTIGSSLSSADATSLYNALNTYLVAVGAA